MALLNRIFSSRRKTFNKCQDNVCDKLFTFTNDQVRVVVFRECDFRGRKLLFDSQTVQKVPLGDEDGAEPQLPQRRGAGADPVQSANAGRKFVEVTNTHGYMYSKPSCDVGRLGEIIFGSVAMSYRGTTYKVHNLPAPSRLMCSQVFPSRRNPVRPRTSAPSQLQVHSASNTNSSLEHSIRLEDSSGSSATTCSDQSVQSGTSDTILVCKRQRSIPLDVPVNSSLVSSSGFGDGNSYSSVSSGPQSIPVDLSQGNSQQYSSDSLCKKWMKSTSTSLEPLSNSFGGSGSTEESFPKSHVRSSKIGLAVVLELSNGQEEKLENFLMDHAAMIELLMWRIRRGVEGAYIRHNTFVSTMHDIASQTARWLVDFLTGSSIFTNMWKSVVSNCDNLFSIINKTSSINFYGHLSGCECECEETSLNFDPGSIRLSGLSNSGLLLSLKQESNTANNEFTFLNLSRFLKADKHPVKHTDNNTHQAEKFIKEFCELLENIDVKNTNFFISTLVTAILTHHLGWVKTTVLLNSTNCNSSANPLWNQLADLYGAVGYPVKMSRTLITGSKSELVPKIINALTYFIRCTNVKRLLHQRVDVEKENRDADDICSKYSCIPKENFKKYEDHLREIDISNKNIKTEKLETDTIQQTFVKPAKKLGLIRTTTCLTELNKLVENECNTIKSDSELIGACKPSSCFTLDTVMFSSDKQSQESKTECGNNNVVFVLGDDEKLIGLKRENSVQKRPVNLNFGKSTLHCDSESSPEGAYCKPVFTFDVKNNEPTLPFNDCDFTNCDSKTIIKPSTSYTSMQKINPDEKRAQSEPPKDKTPEPLPSATRYKYSGVKFNFQQYPQIFENYMKSKNIELSNMSTTEKKLDYRWQSNTIFDLPKCDETTEYEEGEPLTTPSNASELEFTSDLMTEKPEVHKVKEVLEVPKMKRLEFRRNVLPNTVIKEPMGFETCNYFDGGEKAFTNLRFIEMPMPKYEEIPIKNESIDYTISLIRGFGSHYVSDMVLQGTSAPKSEWESILKKDLVLSAQRTFTNQQIEESVAIIANTDTWDVQLLSSHKYVIDRSATGIPVGMSQLVANMLDTLLQMWKLQTPAEYCLLHIEQQLQEFCLRSKALAQLLLDTDFCSMEMLTSTLHLEVNDVPLLMAIASTHTPQVTQKYGLSFQ